MVVVHGRAKVKGCKKENAHLIQHGFQIKSCRVSYAAQESNQAMIHKHSIACKSCMQENCIMWWPESLAYNQHTRDLVVVFTSFSRAQELACISSFVALTDIQQLQHFRCAGVCLPTSFVCACQPQIGIQSEQSRCQ